MLSEKHGGRAIIIADDLAFVLKVSEAVVAQSIFCAGIHLTA